jgi:SAM-dependent methyltransferase
VNHKLTEKEIRELEKQLSCPSGSKGIEIGVRMNSSNIGMTTKSIQSLQLEGDNSVLELGHGNCAHLNQILKVSEKIKYFGLEVSETMWKESQKKSTTDRAKFELYDGHTIPHPDRCFNRILTVNTIYFWSKPEALLLEISRVLKPGGIFVLSFIDKDFMQSLPFVGKEFKLFDIDDIYLLADKSHLRIIDFKSESEEIENKMGDKVVRKYTVVKMSK